ncbi:UNVERIFIED_ORG: hypothetical protein CLV66_12052 [Actinomadura viridilutea]|uniref:hypothetical protein n=1 Tax=Actinomadura rubrobrunea TaxID=115335 RepID=UPI000D26D7BD|nr:hypothetical protein [Actinomadura rubrobrunea]
MAVECGRPRSDFGSTYGACRSDAWVCAVCSAALLSAALLAALFSAVLLAALAVAVDRARVVRGLAAVEVRRVAPDRAVPVVLRVVVPAARDELVVRRAAVDVPRLVPAVEALVRDAVVRPAVLRPVVLRLAVLRPVVLRLVVLRERPAVVVPDRDAVDRRDVVPEAVGGFTLVMARAAEFIALAASAIALVAVVIAFVMAVMALADDDAFDATDLIWVAADFACVAAWVTLLAAAVCVRLAAVVERDLAVVERDVDVRDAVDRDDAGLRAVVVRRAVPVEDRDDVPRRAVAVVRDAVAVRAAAVRLLVVVLLAALLAAVFAAVLAALLVRPAVLRLDVAPDAVLVATDLPPVMISCGGTIPLLAGLYTPPASSLSENAQLKRVRHPPDATPSWSPGTPSCARCRGRPSSRRRRDAAPA